MGNDLAYIEMKYRSKTLKASCGLKALGGGFEKSFFAFENSLGAGKPAGRQQGRQQAVESRLGGVQLFAHRVFD